MRTMTIGKSQVQTSVVSLGTWAAGGGTWWGSREDEAAVTAIRTAVDAGITFVDTAPVYGFGLSEKLVGEALRGRREKTAISTKCGMVWEGDEGSPFFDIDGYSVRRNLSPASIEREVNLSLERLQTDYIDVYFTHWQSVEPFFTPIAQTMEALMKLKAQGVIRAIGASNVTVENIEEYLKHGQLDIIQEKYSLLDRRVEAELLPACKQYGITLQAYTPLEQGILTGKIRKDFVPVANSVRAKMQWFQPDMMPRVIDMVDGWQEMCDKYRCSRTQLVIGWLRAQGDNVNVACGARKSEHIADIVGGMDVRLDAADAKRMREEAEALQ